MVSSDLTSLHALIIGAQRKKGSTLVVGVTGGVAAGKSTFSSSLATELTNTTDLRCAVVSSDGFLYPNSVLADRGLADRKGFPDSYDVAAIEQFLSDAHAGRPTALPVYDHHTYDIVDAFTEIPPVDIVVFEGVNALQFSSRLDLGVYLHVDEPVMREWFVQRTIAFREAARTDYSPFFDPWLDVPEDLFLTMVVGAWESVNLPNLIHHIEPTKSLADVVVEWDADHVVRTVTLLELP